MIFRSLVWLNPPMEPKIIDIAARPASILGLDIVSRKIGGIFWIVARIMFVIQGSPSITCGSQKWKGAAPIFMTRAVVMMVCIS